MTIHFGNTSQDGFEWSSAYNDAADNSGRIVRKMLEELRQRIVRTAGSFPAAAAAD